jgi:hypothetical protein
VTRPEVKILEDGDQAKAVTEEHKPGQVDMYVDASVRNGRAGISIYITPSQVRISRTVASSKQANTHIIELMAISEAAIRSWDPTVTALDGYGRLTPATTVRIFSDAL